ncbi:flavodoxin domain-containing protein [Actinomadura sp. WMMB 499]|uniref:flavodoxin domain-containing protein n=1 Tax=Actinomadura sp. WMMB 499 TaxID=1219491 RepID=UPI0012479BFB|nr:flavodoxin domain-containing protein [Actinomadura sp. WMMB 499]QFG21273.1 flavodoxin [Actinomadura sp. WMMB 499]
MNVLIAYASVHGSTASIAHRIGEVLAGHGERTEVRPMDELGDGVHGHDAFVLGSAVHEMTWLPPATEFVSRNRDVLADRPVWLFSVGMPAALREPWRRLAPKEESDITEPLLRLLTPEGHRLFSGVIRPEHLPRSGRLMFKALGFRYGDYRDWDDVRRWAEEIARSLAADRRGAAL